jgi:hypothetical protein
MNFFYHKDLGNHVLQLCPKVVEHPVYAETWPSRSGVRRKADDLSLQINYCCEIQASKKSDGKYTSLAEYSKEGFGSRKAVLPVTMR